jgi:hypothetical protein
MARRRLPVAEGDEAAELGRLLRRQMSAQAEADRVARGEPPPSHPAAPLWVDPTAAAHVLLERIGARCGRPIDAAEVPALHHRIYAHDGSTTP